MLHNLILGKSTSGKSTLAKIMAKRLQAAGVRVAVLDPMRDTWPADVQTHDPERYLAWANSTAALGKWALFIDESSLSVDRHDPRFKVLATTHRHLGHVCYFIAQRLTQLPPDIRDQCEVRWVFRTELDDAEELARKCNAQQLLDAPSFARGQFLLIQPFEEPKAGQIVLGKIPRVVLK